MWKNEKEKFLKILKFEKKMMGTYGAPFADRKKTDQTVQPRISEKNFF